MPDNIYLDGNKDDFFVDGATNIFIEETKQIIETSKQLNEASKKLNEEIKKQLEADSDKYSLETDEMKPLLHARSSAKKFGGNPADYLSIHEYMDSTKSVIPSNVHRAIFHTGFGCFIIERVFGLTITNSDGKEVSTRDIAEEHILEDFHGYIPTLQDYLELIPFQPWMSGKGLPPSAKNLHQDKTTTITNWKND